MLTRRDLLKLFAAAPLVSLIPPGGHQQPVTFDAPRIDPCPFQGDEFTLFLPDGVTFKLRGRVLTTGPMPPHSITLGTSEGRLHLAFTGPVTYWHRHSPIREEDGPQPARTTKLRMHDREIEIHDVELPSAERHIMVG